MNTIKKGQCESEIIILFLVFFLHKYPAIEIRFPVFLYWGVTVVLFVLLLMNRKHDKLKSSIIFSIFGLSFMSYALLVSRTPILLGTYLLKALELFIYLMMGRFLILSKKTKLVSFTLLYVFVYYVVTAITTNIGCQLYPLASRDLANGAQGDSTLVAVYKQLNIGGFDYIYSVVLTVPLIVGYIRIKHNLHSSLIGFASLIIIALAIIVSQYTTALMIYLLGIVSFFFKKESKSYLKPLLSVGVLFVIVTPLLNALSSYIEGDVLSARVNDIFDFLMGNQNSITQIDGMDSRVEKWIKSMDFIISYPIVGAWFAARVGGHSFVLDNVAIFGILGIVLLVYMYKNVKTYLVVKYSGQISFIYLRYVLLLSIIIAILNPVSNIEFLVFELPLAGYFLTNLK